LFGDGQSVFVGRVEGHFDGLVFFVYDDLVVFSGHFDVFNGLEKFDEGGFRGVSFDGGFEPGSSLVLGFGDFENSFGGGDGAFVEFFEGDIFYFVFVLESFSHFLSVFGFGDVSVVPNVFDGHFVLGKGSGFIRADTGGGPEGFDSF
jgi:hypothetical protein